jgi:hypothetical protein
MTPEGCSAVLCLWAKASSNHDSDWKKDSLEYEEIADGASRKI